MLSIGKGTHGFTLSAEDKFVLSHPNLSIKAEGAIYSVNQGNVNKFDEKLKSFIAWCGESDKTTLRPFGLRYIGSMVGDLHRTILKGGIFFYPANKGETKGKLRLLYECIPMSFLVAQAGGAASDGNQSILEIQPKEIHERTAIFIGSAKTVEKCLEFIQGKVLA
jgi:fructose-1,6-bisphosphatase I